MRKAMLALVAVLVVVAVPAAGEDRGFYIGAGMGVSSFDVAEFNEELGDIRFESDNFGVKVFAGYRFFKHLAVEAGYTDFGQVRKWETSTSAHDQSLKVSISDWDASAVGILPLGAKAALFAKVGMAAWSTDVTADYGDGPSTESSSGTDFAYGLGLDFLFKKFGLRLGGDWLEIPDTSGAFMLSGSLTYRF